MPNTRKETQHNPDLDSFPPAPAERRIDDKAAALESEIQSLKLSFGRERFIYIFLLVALFYFGIAPHLSNFLQIGLAVTSIVFLSGLGRFYDFHWISLARWDDLAHEVCRKKLLKEKQVAEIKEEPLPPLDLTEAAANKDEAIR